MSETVRDESALRAADSSVAGSAQSGARRVLLSRDGILIAILVIFLIFASLVLPRFASPITVGYLLLNAVPILMLALPMTLIIITGEIDLSVASIVGMSAALIGALTLNGVPFPVAAIAAVGSGVIAGVINGVLVAYVGLPSLAVTIGTLALFRGLALVFIGDNAVGSFPSDLTKFVTSKLDPTGIPTVMIGVAIVAAIFVIVLHYTPFGRGLYAMGYSKEAALFVGVKVNHSKFLLYVASGLVCGVIGLYWVLNYSSARADSATGLELTVIAAVLLGGVSIFGGRGTIAGALAGVLLISSINYALRLQRVSDTILVIITGSLLIISVIGPSIFATVRQRRLTRRMQKQAPQA
jgi:rhamnose transport system permease protein